MSYFHSLLNVRADSDDDDVVDSEEEDSDSDDDEPTDIRPALMKEAHDHCLKEWNAYESCGDRLNNDPSIEGDCSGFYLDYLHCVDNNMAQELFRQLK